MPPWVGAVRWGVAALCTLLALGADWEARAGSIPLGGPPAGGGTAALKVESFQERKFSTTIAQQHDFSCGSAAVATLLTHTYGVPTPEKDVFDSMFSQGDKAIIGAEGFSLLDMKQYLARRGLQAEGFRAPLAKLVEVGVPAIVLINVRGYNHFVVLEGVQDGRVLLSDPAVGTRTMPVSEFMPRWNGIFFLIRGDVARAQRRFNDAKTWATMPGGPSILARYVLDFALLAQPASRGNGRF